MTRDLAGPTRPGFKNQYKVSMTNSKEVEEASIAGQFAMTTVNLVRDG